MFPIDAMPLFERSVFFLIDLGLPLLVGIMIRRTGRASEQSMDRLTFAGIFVVMPILNLISFWSVDLAQFFFLLPIVGISMQLISGGLGYLVAIKKYSRPQDQGAFVLASMFSNRGLAGTLTVYLFYGEGAYAISRLVLVFNNLFLYLVGFPIARWFSRQDPNKRLKEPRKSLISFGRTQLPVMGFLAGLALNIAGVPRPPIFASWFEFLIHTSAWLVVIPIGYALQLDAIRSYGGHVWELLGIKFFLSPLLVAIVAIGLGFEGTSLKILIILAASPSAISAIFTTRIHRLNQQLAIAAFTVTMLFYPLIIIPLIILLESLIY